MIKRDRIFYIGCGLVAVGIALAFMGYDVSILAFVGAYLLRPTLHALGIAGKYADERQIQIFSRSGNVGFLVVMFGATLLAILRLAQGKSPEDLYALIMLGLAAKAIIGLLMIGDLRKAGVIILISYGVFMGIFAGLQGFNEIEAGETPWETFAGVGLIVVCTALGLTARKYPRPVAAVLMIGAVAFIWFLELWEFGDKAVGVWIFIVLPLVSIAACLWGKSETDSLPVAG